jgi:hypothetical protein
MALMRLTASSAMGEIFWTTPLPFQAVTLTYASSKNFRHA